MALSMRLDKYLSHMGFGTRNDVKKLIKAPLLQMGGK